MDIGTTWTLESTKFKHVKRDELYIYSDICFDHEAEVTLLILRSYRKILDFSDGKAI